jgi:hypothetical protein
MITDPARVADAGCSLFAHQFRQLSDLLVYMVVDISGACA